MKKLYKIELDGNKAYLTRMFQGEMLITSIVPNGRRSMGALDAARDAIVRGIRNRRANNKYSDNVVDQKYTISDSPNRIVMLLEGKKRNILNTNKKPTNRTKHVGVEIEFISPLDQDEIKTLLIDKGLESYVNLTTDGSVSDPEAECDGTCRDECNCSYCDDSSCGHCNCEIVHHCNGEEDCSCEVNCETSHCDGEHECDCDCTCGNGGHELRIIAPQKIIKDIIVKVCSVLKDAKAKVNQTCGLHVHLDMRSRDVKLAFANLVTLQPLLYSMVPSSRRTGGYSVPTNNKIFQETNNRYVGINPNSFSKHKTIEVRLHSGTVSAKKINNWIELLLSIVEHKQAITSIKTISGVAKRLSLSDSLVEYIQERSLLFLNFNSFDQQKLKSLAA